VFAIVTLLAANGIAATRFYVGQQFTPSHLFLYDSETNDLNLIGRVQESGVDVHITALHYDEQTGRLFGATPWQSPTSQQAIIEINPANGNGAFSRFQWCLCLSRPVPFFRCRFVVL
jgi:hypothetical protein